MQAKSQPKSDCQIREKLSKFWQLENFGIESENGLVYDRFEETVVFDGTRYQVSLPFKEGHALLSDNFTLSKQRLMSLLKWLKTQPQVLTEYNDILEEQECLGIIEMVPDLMSSMAWVKRCFSEK